MPKKKIDNSKISESAGFPAMIGNRLGGMFIIYYDGYHGIFSYEKEEGEFKDLVSVEISRSTFGSVKECLDWFKGFGITPIRSEEDIIKEYTLGE